MENQKEGKTGNTDLRQKTRSRVTIILLVAIGFWIGGTIGVGLYLDNYMPYLQEKKALKQAQAYDEYLKEIHKNDNIGGDTPEETMDLFIEALKKEDYDLASKYFVAEEQEKWKKDFLEMKNAGRGQGLVKELEDAKKIWRTEYQGEKQFVFKYNTGTGEEEITNYIVLEKIPTNKWKIGSF